MRKIIKMKTRTNSKQNSYSSNSNNNNKSSWTDECVFKHNLKHVCLPTTNNNNYNNINFKNNVTYTCIQIKTRKKNSKKIIVKKQIPSKKFEEIAKLVREKFRSRLAYCRALRAFSSFHIYLYIRIYMITHTHIHIHDTLLYIITSLSSGKTAKLHQQQQRQLMHKSYLVCRCVTHTHSHPHTHTHHSHTLPPYNIHT